MTDSLAHSRTVGQHADRVAAFEQLRARLFGIAYRMLGSVDDANDLVQETYLRWHQADNSVIRAPEGWLVAVMTRLSIDRLRRAEREREHYVGPWLPEPISTAGPSAPDRQAELASDLSMAFLVLLERLAPEERAALLLREVLDAGYDEIARILEKSESACRQIVHRARARVREDRPRFAVAADAKERLVARFVAALGAADRDTLLSLVAPEATFVSDGGGKVSAARRALHGADRIIRFLLGLERKWGTMRDFEIAWINGEPAMLTYADGRLIATTSMEVDGDRLVGFYRVMNPEKLGRVARRDGAPPLPTTVSPAPPAS